jgi:hypothetical protein
MKKIDQIPFWKLNVGSSRLDVQFVRSTPVEDPAKGGEILTAKGIAKAPKRFLFPSEQRCNGN